MTGEQATRGLSGSRRSALLVLVALPAVGALALVLLVPESTNSWGRWLIEACAAGFLVAWTRWRRPWLGTGFCVLLVGAVAVRPGFPIGAAVGGAALCATFLLLADAAESGAGLPDLAGWMSCRWWWIPTAVVALGAAVLGAELPVMGAPFEVAVGAACAAALVWLAVWRR